MGRNFGISSVARCNDDGDSGRGGHGSRAHQEARAKGKVRQLPRRAKKVRLCTPMRAVRAPRRRGFVRRRGADDVVHDVLVTARKVQQGAAVRALHSGWARLLVFERLGQNGGEKTPARESFGGPAEPRGVGGGKFRQWRDEPARR